MAGQQAAACVIGHAVNDGCLVAARRRQEGDLDKIVQRVVLVAPQATVQIALGDQPVACIPFETVGLAIFVVQRKQAPIVVMVVADLSTERIDAQLQLATAVTPVLGNVTCRVDVVGQ